MLNVRRVNEGWGFYTPRGIDIMAPCMISPIDLKNPLSPISADIKLLKDLIYLYED